MVDFLYSIYLRTMKWHNPFSRIVRFLLSVIANSLLPIFYSISPLKKKHSCQDTSQIVVSLTSYPARINRTWLTIETILRQSLKPSKLVLWLSKNQFPGELKDVPKRIVQQMARGLDIQFVEGDIRSHKKYYYAFHQYPQNPIFLIDDDILFPSVILSDSYLLLEKNRDSVVANFGFWYRWNLDNQYFDIVRDDLSPDEMINVFFGSGGGTLLIPDSMASLLDPVDELMTMCPTADDIYLNGLARVANKPIIFASNNPLLTIFEKGTSLLSENGSIGSVSSRNAEQLRSFVSHCIKKYGANPFLDKE